MQAIRQQATHIALVGLSTLALVAGCTDHSVTTANAPAVGTATSGTPAMPSGTGVRKGPPLPLTTALLPTFVQYSSSISLSAGVRVIGAAGGTVTAGHFSLSIPAGALTVALPITITETNVLYEQCAIEPTGLTFRKSATLTFSYAGTSADPASPTYVAAGTLSGQWFDPSSSAWTSIGGTDNAAAKTFASSLGHLSYYALAK